MELELGEDELDVGANERAVACMRGKSVQVLYRLEEARLTARSVTSNCSRTRFQPRRLSLRLLESLCGTTLPRSAFYSSNIEAERSARPTHNRVTFLQNLVDRDEGLERLNLVREDGLDAQGCPDRGRRAVVPGVDDGL
jgi:hypothetical protein